MSHHIADLILTGVFFLAGVVALAAAIADWDWFFGTRSARSLGGKDRKRGRILYGLIGVSMITGAILLLID